jgi:hypothetical protein
MKANGIDEVYTKDPLESSEGKLLIENYKEALRKNDYSHYYKERIEETLNLLGIIK